MDSIGEFVKDHQITYRTLIGRLSPTTKTFCMKDLFVNLHKLVRDQIIVASSRRSSVKLTRLAEQARIGPELRFFGSDVKEMTQDELIGIIAAYQRGEFGVTIPK